jgi:hypothetical protein
VCGEKPILDWVRDDSPDVVLTGGAVLAGKVVRLQAEWPLWGYYTGPERFMIRAARTRFARSRNVGEIAADIDGPPRTHSLHPWQAGLRSPTHQRRYYFTDLQKNKSGELTVSNVAHYTTAPTIGIDAQMSGVLPAIVRGGVVAHAGQARTTYRIGATTDPRVRVTIMVNSGDGSETDLMPYLPQPPRYPSPSRADDLLYVPVRESWRPMFEDGRHALLLDVEEDRFAEITLVSDQSYGDRFPFMTAFALRVENVDDPTQFVISDIVTVQGGDFAFRRNYPEGTVLFRT